MYPSVFLEVFGWFFLLFCLWPHDVDGGGIELGLDMGGIVLLDHLDTGTAVFGDLIDVGTFHQAQTNICVSEAIGRSRSAFTIQSEVLLIKDGLEKLALPFRKDQVCRFWKTQFSGPVRRGFWSVLVLACRTESGLQSLERAHGAAHALAVAYTALAAHLDLKDGLPARVVFNDCHVPELKAPCFIRPKAGVGREQDVVVKLFRLPFVARHLRLVRALSCRFVELFVLLGREPGSVRDFCG